jgi:hypothetical protein
MVTIKYSYTFLYNLGAVDALTINSIRYRTHILSSFLYTQLHFKNQNIAYQDQSLLLSLIECSTNIQTIGITPVISYLPSNIKMWFNILISIHILITHISFKVNQKRNMVINLTFKHPLLHYILLS